MPQELINCSVWSSVLTIDWTLETSVIIIIIIVVSVRTQSKEFSLKYLFLGIISHTCIYHIKFMFMKYQKKQLSNVAYNMLCFRKLSNSRSNFFCSNSKRNSSMLPSPWTVKLVCICNRPDGIINLSKCKINRTCRLVFLGLWKKWLMELLSDEKNCKKYVELLIKNILTVHV